MQFFMVYIREAHAIDSRVPFGDGPLVEDPINDLERRTVAQRCTTALKLAMIPTLVDGVDDAVNRAYSGWPDRLFLVGRDGKLAYSGGRGPFGFKPDELASAIAKELEKKEKPPKR